MEQIGFIAGANQEVQIRNFIDGQFVEPIGGKDLENIEPATGKPSSQVVVVALG